MSDTLLCADDLTAYLAARDPFRDLDPETLAELGRSLELVCLPSGAVLFRQGDPADGLYVLLAGRLSIVIAGEEGETEVDRLEPGVTVGEMALLSGQVRSATVYAVDDVELVRVSRSSFEAIAQSHPDMVLRFATGIAPRIHRTELAGVLTHLFGALDAPGLHALQSELTWRTVPRDEVLFRQGQPSDALYLVVHGRISLSMIDRNGCERPVAELTRGAVLGEAAMLTGESHDATARAIRDSIVAILSRQAFERVTSRYPKAVTQIIRVAFARERKRAAGLTGTGARCDTVFALVPVTAGVPLHACGLELAKVLGQDTRVLHLTSAAFDARYCKPGLSQTEPTHPIDTLLVARLSEVEREYAYVIYEADSEPTAWSQRCVRQADRVLLVANGKERPPEPGSMSDTVLSRCGGGIRSELLLVQPSDCNRPSGTGAWLDRFPTVNEHHHARLGHKGDWDRMVRRLTGRATGLVLSGGGARGIVHAGVWRALQETGVEIDVFGGTSMGAIVGALCAMGLDHERLMRATKKELNSLPRLADPTLPLVSFLATGKIFAALSHLYGDTQIEDLWWPFFAMATNLSQGVPVIQRRGSLARAVRASMAVPGIFAPVCRDHQVYVDGGVLNNLPIDVMYGLIHGGKIVAVNAWPEAEMTGNYCFGDSVSGVTALIERLNPLNDKQGAPLLFETLFRLLSLGGAGQLPAWRALVDLYICPPVERYSPLAFSSYEPLFQIGYHAAIQALAAGASRLHTGFNFSPSPTQSPDTTRLQGTLSELERLLDRIRRNPLTPHTASDIIDN